MCLKFDQEWRPRKWSDLKNKTNLCKGKVWYRPGIITERTISGNNDLHENSYLWNGNSQAISF